MAGSLLEDGWVQGKASVASSPLHSRDEGGRDSRWDDIQYDTKEVELHSLSQQKKPSLSPQPIFSPLGIVTKKNLKKIP